MDQSSLIVGDFGGTNTRLALLRREGTGWHWGAVLVTPTEADAAAVLHAFWQAEGAPRLAGAALCGAGPLLQGRIALTNSEAVLDARALAATLGTHSVILLNDFEALAWSLPSLGGGDTKVLNEGVADTAAPMLVLGPGTGFGAAALLPSAWGHTVVSGEAGHARLAAGSASEGDLWQAVEAGNGPLTIESILSGNGLTRLHRAHSGITLAPAAVAEAASNGVRAAQQSIEIFVRTLARVAADLALVFGARGGVYLAGGMLPKWGSHFPAAVFQQEFTQRERMGALLSATPVHLITAPYPALWGLAAVWQRSEKFPTLA